MLLMRFVHLLAMSVWIGGLFSGLVIAGQARVQTGLARKSSYGLLGKVYSIVIGPAVLITTVTGIALTMSVAQQVGSSAMGHPRLWVMQVTGLLAGVLALFVELPSASGLARLAGSLDEGATSPAFERLQRRLSTVSQLVAVLFIVAMYFATAVR
jgi:putative copper export protein